MPGTDDPERTESRWPIRLRRADATRLRSIVVRSTQTFALLVRRVERHRRQSPLQAAVIQRGQGDPDHGLVERSKLLEQGQSALEEPARAHTIAGLSVQGCLGDERPCQLVPRADVFEDPNRHRELRCGGRRIVDGEDSPRTRSAIPSKCR